jgi:hypothetical protein
MPSRTLRGLQLTALTMVTLLVGQFVAGMVANLYVQVPATIPGDKPGHHGAVLHDIGWALTQGPLDLQIHVANALLLVLSSLIMAGFGIAAKRAVWVTTTLIGAAAMAAAFEGGIGFLAGGGHAGDSLLMALGFMSAFLSYGTGFYLSRAPRSASGPRARKLP